MTELPTAVTMSALAGPFLAGAVGEPAKFDGAVEGMVAAGVAVPLAIVAVAISWFLTFQATEAPLRLLWLTGGPQAIGAVFVVLPLALVGGAMTGWLGQLVRDLATAGVSIAGS